MAALSLGELNRYRQQPWQDLRCERHETMVLLPAQTPRGCRGDQDGDRSREILPGHPREALLFHNIGAVPSPILADVLDLGANTAVRWAALSDRVRGRRSPRRQDMATPTSGRGGDVCEASVASAPVSLRGATPELWTW